MYMTRPQIVGLMGLCMITPVDATYDISTADNNGEFFVTVRSPVFGAAEGGDPMWKLPKEGSYELVREVVPAGPITVDSSLEEPPYNGDSD